MAVVRMPPQAHVTENGRTMNIKSLPRGSDTKTWSATWAYEIGRQVRAGKHVMGFYYFIKKDLKWPSMNQVEAAIFAMGDIDQKRDTVMHNNLMDGKVKKQVLSNTKVES